MKEILKMIYMNEKELKNIQMRKDIKVIFMKDSLKEMISGIIEIIVNWKVFGKKERKMEKQKKLWNGDIYEIIYKDGEKIEVKPMSK